MKNLKNESGIAVILALIMLLIMSSLAVTVSFMSNVDFQNMSNFKRGQESFLAAERCVEEVRRTLESVGVGTLYSLIQAGVVIPQSTLEIKIGKNGIDCDMEPEKCSICRTGPRDATGPSLFPQVSLEKVRAVPLRNTELPKSGTGGNAGGFPSITTVTGKDMRDEDKDDSDPKINTGTEIIVEIESFEAGLGSPAY